MKEAGADKAQVRVTHKKKYEFNNGFGKVNLLKTTSNVSIEFTVIKDSRQSVSTINKIDDKSINEHIEQIFCTIEQSNVDPCYDIAEFQKPKVFAQGPNQPDLNILFEISNKLIKTIEHNHPKVICKFCVIDFTATERHYKNTNGVDFISHIGNYHLIVRCTAKEGKESSSVNYYYNSVKEINFDKFYQLDLITMLNQLVDHITPQRISQKFNGDVIVTPYCFNDILSIYIQYIQNPYIIKNISVFQDKLNQKIASLVKLYFIG